MRRTSPRELAEWAAWSVDPERPLFSVILPTYNSNHEWLAAAIESVRTQIYSRWELCIADDASTDPVVRNIIEGYAALDPRVKFVARTSNGHISAASNSAIQIAQGDYLVLLDHDDLLAPTALVITAVAIERTPGIKLLFSDEDKIDADGKFFGAYRKHGLDRDLFRSINGFSHMGVLERELVRELGGFRAGFEGSQDHDLLLRCLERVTDAEVDHLPFVLYHWRVHAGSTSDGGGAKPYAERAASQAVIQHRDRLLSSNVAPPGKRMTATIHVDQILDPEHVNAVIAESAAEFFLLRARSGEIDDRLVNESLTDLLSLPGVGVVGGRVMTHSGITVGGALEVKRGWGGRGVVAPLFRGISHRALPFGDDTFTRTVTAVSGSFMAFSRRSWELVGGFDSSLADVSDVDFCLRLGAKGLRTVYAPDFRLRLEASPARRSRRGRRALVDHHALGSHDPAYPKDLRPRFGRWAERWRVDRDGTAWLRLALPTIARAPTSVADPR